MTAHELNPHRTRVRSGEKNVARVRTEEGDRVHADFFDEELGLAAAVAGEGRYDCVGALGWHGACKENARRGEVKAGGVKVEGEGQEHDERLHERQVQTTRTCRSATSSRVGWSRSARPAARASDVRPGLWQTRGLGALAGCHLLGW